MAKGQDLGGGLFVSVEPRERGTKATLSGAVTELVNFAFLTSLPGPVVIDLDAVDRMNSLGVRAWCHFVRDAEAAGLALTFERCSPMIIQQLAMISNFFGAKSQVASLQVPYYCEGCGTEHLQLVERAAGAPISVPASIVCGKCGTVAPVDEPGDMYATLSKALVGR